jgi:2-dehydro-3-deoxy-D-gluconate 5-dehydrogenase
LSALCDALLPGWTDTKLIREARQQVTGLRKRVLTRAGRWGVPDDLAGIAVFLASPASVFISDAAIPVEGDFSATAIQFRNKDLWYFVRKR